MMPSEVRLRLRLHNGNFQAITSASNVKQEILSAYNLLIIFPTAHIIAEYQGLVLRIFAAEERGLTLLSAHTGTTASADDFLCSLRTAWPVELAFGWFLHEAIRTAWDNREAQRDDGGNEIILHVEPGLVSVVETARDVTVHIIGEFRNQTLRASGNPEGLALQKKVRKIK